MYFYKYDNNDIPHAIDDNVSGDGGVELINIPFPKNIYLGWAFDDNDNSEKKKLEIMKFCKDHHIRLFQLKRYFDYQERKFISHEL